MIRIGIDVGGTNTDAVMMDGREVLAATKTATTHEVMSGVRQAMQSVIDRAGIGPEQVVHVMIGTTHFTNAVVERRQLSTVAAIRLGLPAAACLPPMVDWPEELRAALGDHGYMLRGGHEYDGRVLSDLDTAGLDRIAEDIESGNIAAAAITSIFGPVNPAMEEEARRRLLERLPDLDVVLSSDIGRVGLLERGERDDPERGPTRAGRGHRRRLRRGGRRGRSGLRVLGDPERRHVDECCARPPLPGPDLRLGPDELPAGGRVS